MSPLDDDTRRELKAEKQGGSRLGRAPAHGAPESDFQDYLSRAYGLPEGYTVAGVERHGGRPKTPLVVCITTPGRGKLAIRYPEEKLAQSASTLRSTAAAATGGLTRGALITTHTVGDVFESLCSLATLQAEDVSPAVEMRSHVSALELAAHALTGHTLEGDGRFDALYRLKLHAYERRDALAPKHVDDRGRPALLIDRETHERYVTAGHLATFVRHELGVEGLGDHDALRGRMLEIGAEHVPMQQWNARRTFKVTLVLYRLPNDTEGE